MNSMAARWMASNVRTGIGTGSSARPSAGGAISMVPIRPIGRGRHGGEPRSRRALIRFQTSDSSRPRENRRIPRSTDGNYQPIDGRAPRTIRDRSSFGSVSLQIGQDVTQFHHRFLPAFLLQPVAVPQSTLGERHRGGGPVGNEEFAAKLRLTL